MSRLDHHCHPDVLEAYPTICRWVTGGTVSTEDLARELREAADKKQAAVDKFAAIGKGER